MSGVGNDSYISAGRADALGQHLSAVLSDVEVVHLTALTGTEV